MNKKQQININKNFLSLNPQTITWEEYDELRRRIVIERIE